MEYEILPQEWEKGKIFKVIYGSNKGKKLYPDKHFSLLMDYIAEQAAEKHGYIID
jgi:hypothetical protein